MVLNKVKSISLRTVAILQSIWMRREQKSLMVGETFSEAVRLFPTRNSLHAYMHHYYTNRCPDQIKNHRRYFNQQQRGYGEDAFHAMWYLIIKEFKPYKCLEIGVYRGQVISLWGLISQLNKNEVEIFGISPFTPAGDAVSEYPLGVDYLNDTINNHAVFGVKKPVLLKSFSTDEAAKNLINRNQWDLIYIDGSHDFEVALSDYELAKSNLKPGGLLVIDDSSLFSDYKPPLFSFAGHPGPSKVVRDRAVNELEFIAAVGHNNVFRKAAR